MDESVDAQLFPDDSMNLGVPLRVNTRVVLSGACIGSDETEYLLKDLGPLAGEVAPLDVAFVLDLGAGGSFVVTGTGTGVAGDWHVSHGIGGQLDARADPRVCGDVSGAMGAR